MTTKEQERKALEQIKKIVAGLGEDSYIATAFAGCFEDAERNIDEDAAYSMKERWEAADRKLEVETARVISLKEENAAKAQRIAEISAMYNDIVKERNNYAEAAMYERKDIVIETTDGDHRCTSFAKVEYFDNDGFRFINVVEKSGWTTSYKIDDLKTLRIE